MKKYPDINNLRLGMSFNEAKIAVLEMTYDIRPLKTITLDCYDIFDPDKESDNNKNAHLIFDKHRLSTICIDNWCEFFDLNITFDNLIDVFIQYYLKDYKFEKTLSNYGDVTLKSKFWEIYFRKVDEYIIYEKRI